MRSIHRGRYRPALLALAAALGVLAGAGLGCLETSSFVCSGDEACDLVDGGRCEEIGHCSYPDAECPLGRRYADGGELGDACVGGTPVGTESAIQTSTGSSTTESGTAASSTGEATSGGTV